MKTKKRKKQQKRIRGSFQVLPARLSLMFAEGGEVSALPQVVNRPLEELFKTERQGIASAVYTQILLKNGHLPKIAKL
jgi:hypothetical protein